MLYFLDFDSFIMHRNVSMRQNGSGMNLITSYLSDLYYFVFNLFIFVVYKF